jgi:hypothetical protein
MKRKIIAVLGFFLGAGSADAATVEVVLLKDKLYKSVITVTGKFELGDQNTFRTKLASAPQPSIVAFNSPGGALAVGIDIGELIKAAKLPTYVPSMMTCASACALAWLAGGPRYMQGKVGFHAAGDGPKHNVSSVGNALAGAYLNKLGMGYRAIVYMTTPSPAPNTVEWLTRAQGLMVGIYFVADDPTAIKAPAPPAPQAAAYKWPDVSVNPDLLPCDGLVGQPCKKTVPLSCAFGRTCTVPGGEIKAVTKDLGTVKVPYVEPPALTTEVVTNAISNRDKQKVSGPYIVHQYDNDVRLEVKP